MKVLVPFDLKNCESDCPFWEVSLNGNKMVCTFDLSMTVIPKVNGIPEFCPLRKFEVK